MLARLSALNQDRIVTFHEHYSLLENKEEQELSEEEKEAAWEEFRRRQVRSSLSGNNFDSY